ncbi:MAG: hypothetical protein V2A78_01305 [bacterium]
MNKTELIEKKLREKAVDGRIPCSEALRIADDLKVNPRLVGEAANKLEIKFEHCQLGCFK